MEQSPASTPHERTLALLSAALYLQQAGEGEEALQVLNKARDLSPDYVPLYLALSSAYRQLGDWQSMEGSLRHALDLAPDNAQALLSLGSLLIYRGRAKEGIPYLQRHLQAVPDSLGTVQALCSALQQTGAAGEARQVFADAWNRLRTEEAGVEYGRFLIQLGEPTEAERVLREVAQCFPTARALAQWATALSLCDRLKEAAQVLEGVTQSEPTDHRAWRGLAFVYDRLEHWEQALAAAERAVQLKDDHYGNWHARATVLLSVERYDQAVQAARRGRELIHRDDARARPVLYDLFDIEIAALDELGQKEQAVQRLAEQRQEFPDRVDPVLDQAELLCDLERYDQALAILHEARAAGMPVTPRLYEVLHRLGRADEALEVVRGDLEVSSELRHRRLHVLCDIAMTSYRQGQHQTAQVIFEQLHELSPEDPRFLNNLAFVWVGEGKLAQAEQAFRTVLQLPKADWLLSMTYLNLSYVYLLRGNYEQAEEALRQTEAALAPLEEGQKAASIARIAYWRDGHVLPEYTPFPTEFCPVHLSAQANRVTLLLAQGHPKLAEDVARQVVKSSSQRSLGYRVLGYVLLAQARKKDAAKAWRQALKRATTPEEANALKAWLAGLV